MLKTLAQIACSALCFVATGLQAKDIPIVKQITLLVPHKEFSVIEFPFEIKAHDFTPFVSMQKEGTLQSEAEQPEFVTPTLDDKKQLPAGSPIAQKNPIQTGQNGKKTPMDVSKGKNFIKLYPRKIGETEMIVWGYSKFPVMIKLKIVENNEEADKLVKFVDYDEHKEEAQKYESAYHDKVVVNLTKALYNNELPKGYTAIATPKEVRSGTFHFLLTKEYQGKRYSGQEYLVTNQGNENVVLDYEIFRGQKGLYGITWTHDVLEPGEKTRLFIIKQRNNDE